MCILYLLTLFLFLFLTLAELVCTFPRVAHALERAYGGL
jgi:hypothetical protein